MSKIIVHLDSMVQWVTERKDKDKKVTGVIIVDTDTEGANDNDTYTITDSNGRQVSAYIHEESVYANDATTEIGHLVETYLDCEDIAEVIDSGDPKELPLLLTKMRTQEGKSKIVSLLKGV